jgi:hypothetical protein
VKQVKFIIFLSLFSSCDKALLVSKKNIIYQQNGYMVFYYDHWAEAFFFPWENINDNDFLKHSHVDGFRLDENKLDYYKDNATTKVINHGSYPDGKIAEDSIKIIPVEINYYWGDHWKLRNIKQQQVNIKYSFQDNQVDLLYTIYNDRYILSISPIKK